MEYFEVKRKTFEVIEKIGERSYKVNRKGKVYYLKDFEDDKKGFEEFVDTEWKLNSTGIAHPKIYVYDKNIHVVVSDFIEGETILEELMKNDLNEKYYELIFKANWFVKKDKVALSFAPEYWKYNNGKLYYLGVICGQYQESIRFEKEHLRLWFYTKDFAKHLVQLGLPVDKNRIPENEAMVNKKMALTVVKYYI